MRKTLSLRKNPKKKPETTKSKPSLTPRPSTREHNVYHQELATLRRIEAREAMLQWRPDIFNELTPVPLKIGIHKDIQEAQDCPLKSRRLLRWFLKEWTGMEAYKAAVSAGFCRVGLEG